LGSAPGEQGRTRALPDVTTDEIAGLLEHLAEAADNRHDLYRLADDLGVDSDRLLLLIGAAELLGFATVAQGDVTLTALGETFAEARILARKEIFATRIRRVPTFKWLIALLRAADKHSLETQVVQTALELEFPPEEAARQVETAVDWGRYAELLAYDDGSAAIYLEAPDPADRP
jgi:NitT/TauT family transport system ATP-binding protein